MAAIEIKATGINKYTIPFLSPLRVGAQTLNARQGFVLELIDVDGARGCGEIAPLEGFSPGTLEQTGQQIHELTERLPGMVFHVDFNNAGCFFPIVKELPGGLYPSVCFGLETAIINLAENSLNQPFSEMITRKLKKQIPVNALLHTDISHVREEVCKLLAEGFKTIKIKVGRKSLAEDIEMVNRATELLPAEVKLRLDANRLWDFETALEFGHRIDKSRLEYIEEPFIIKDVGQITQFFMQTGIAVALDESLNNIITNERDIPQGVHAFILKPTLLGGIQRTGEWVHLAIKYKIKPVISSCFEVGPGFMMLLKMAASIQCDCASGLDTLKYLEGNLLSQPVEIANGFISFIT